MSATKLAVTSSNTESGTPPVFTFSNTRHTASLLVVLPSEMIGELIGPEGVQHLLAEAHVFAELFGGVFPETFFPGIGVEDLIARKEELLALILRE